VFDGTSMDTHTYTVYRYYGERTEDDEPIYEPTTHEGYGSEDEAWQAGLESATGHSENLEDGDEITWEKIYGENKWIITS
jgi:hypothetical protein